MKNKKGQVAVGLSDAPYIVMIVGFTFLVMATIALVGYKYQEGFSTDMDGSVVNETTTAVTEAGVYLEDSRTQCNFNNLVITAVSNGTVANNIPSGLYTYTADGLLTHSGANTTSGNNSIWYVTYTYDFTGTACNITTSMNENLDENTSIAGVVLTISLVGIILSILVGIFLSSRRSGL